MTAPGGDLSILSVCTRNRTRSVMIAALLSRHLLESGASAHVTSAGTTAETLAPIHGVAEQLRRLGVSLPPYVGRQVDSEIARSADLIVTAEPQHVVWIAGRWPDVFERTYTLPELVTYGEVVGPRRGRSLATWLAEVSALRPPPKVYLEPQSVAALPDPTGAPEPIWVDVADRIDDACRRLTDLVA
ncbi:MAG: low molecular weight phosphatase family protein [Actinomycetota bacterium]